MYYYFLRYSLLLLPIAALASSSSVCPNTFVEDWMETNEAVQVSVRRIFSRVLNNSTIANDALSNEEVYKLVATILGVSATSDGFNHFQEAIIEIIVAKLAACSGSKKDQLRVDDISKLVSNFTAFVNAKNLKQVHKIYGKLLCLQGQARKLKSKRQVDPFETFYKSVNGNRLATIFGIANVADLDSKPTLAFAVDDTGSMSEEIKSVQKLIHSFIKTERSEPQAYILTTFNDPEVGVPQKYAAGNATALKALTEAVNALEAHDGGDCSELGMTGILNALSLANLDSNVVVLTDAAPKDTERLDEVIAKATELRNSIHFFLSYDCGDLTPYLNVAKETYGIVVHEIDDFEAFAEFANKVGKFKTKYLHDDSDKKKRQLENCADISTSVFTKSVDIFFSFISTGSVITVTNPLGIIENIIPHGNTAIYNKSPVAGKYKFCSTNTFEYSFSIPSNLDFFVEYVDDNVSSTSLPPPGTSIKIIIFSSRIGEISFTKEIILNLLSNDKIVSSNIIIRCGNLLAGMIVIPNVPFQYQLTGYDTKGNQFSKTKDTVLNPQIEAKMCDHDLPILTSSVLPIPVGFTVSTSSSASSVPYTSTLTMPTPKTTVAAATTATITTTPAGSILSDPSFHCPCRNGGRCFTVVRFGLTRVLCNCPKGYSGSLCQSKLSIPDKK